MKPDIATRKDIELIMRNFYGNLLSDAEIAYIFIDVAKIDLEKHLPHLADFWEQNILNIGSYRNNVLKIHVDLHELEPLTANHFQIWLRHFNATIDESFSGEKSELMKTRALSIATVMQLKLT
ncbi:Globin [Flavobacterium longum]|uniref:group III truncated hemoglobin n=1 Tax=Flavobacterium longum TaxID=1299340 RepID=UPI0039E903A3